MPRVELRPADPSRLDQTSAVRVTPEQERFVSTIEESLLRSVASEALTHEPLFIWSGVKVVGFCSLYTPRRFADRVFLGGFLIAAEHQGRGMGRAALDACLMRVRAHYPRCRAVLLTVHPENERARYLYETAGFRPTGGEISGYLVYDLPLVSRGRVEGPTATP